MISGYNGDIFFRVCEDGHCCVTDWLQDSPGTRFGHDDTNMITTQLRACSTFNLSSVNSLQINHNEGWDNWRSDLVKVKMTSGYWYNCHPAVGNFPITLDEDSPILDMHCDPEMPGNFPFKIYFFSQCQRFPRLCMSGLGHHIPKPLSPIRSKQVKIIYLRVFMLACTLA